MNYEKYCKSVCQVALDLADSVGIEEGVNFLLKKVELFENIRRKLEKDLRNYKDISEQLDGDIDFMDKDRLEVKQRKLKNKIILTIENIRDDHNRLMEKVKGFDTIFDKVDDKVLEKIIGTNNLQDIASLQAQIKWLEKGLKASKSVCKIQLANGGGSGTGFVATYKGEKYLFTNQHVLKTKEMAKNASITFNYETDSSGQYQQTTKYKLDATTYISSPYGQGDNDLDYVRVKVKGLGDEWGSLTFNPQFTFQSGKSTPIAIIQHPQGHPKKISIVDANVEDVKRGFRVYHTADTEYGSSGSPIFDKDWNVIALHHAREIDKDLNKGILFSRIFEDMEAKDKKNGST